LKSRSPEVTRRQKRESDVAGREKDDKRNDAAEHLTLEVSKECEIGTENNEHPAQKNKRPNEAFVGILDDLRVSPHD
jgi:hypothetical protein